MSRIEKYLNTAQTLQEVMNCTLPEAMQIVIQADIAGILDDRLHWLQEAVKLSEDRYNAAIRHN
ncbi:hypothetical protein [Pollutibacter soli]|uniref:hypothetical protein n=1 Tax=Pollutibacter soli TaxID=3034157 RepID=UPI003013848B